LDCSAIGRESAHRALCFAHFGDTILSLIETEKRGEQFHADILQIAPPHILHQDAGDASKANRPINRADRAALRWLDAMR
jgi:hypothetical protein